jgi:hypothetical protein
MSNHPKLIFKLNKPLDKEMCLAFLGVKAGGIDFGRGIITLHPALKELDVLNIEEKKSFISDYVDKYYRQYGRILAKFAKTFTTEWRGVEEQFYRAVNQIFPDHPWSDGLYICYLSIFSSNPRFLENKTFQVYYRHPYGVKHIAVHEMLHFMFYDYVEKNFSNELKGVSFQRIWVLSEVFNNIILSSPEFIKLTGKEPFFYPDHVELTRKLMGVWLKYKDVDALFSFYFHSLYTRGNDKGDKLQEYS